MINSLRCKSMTFSSHVLRRALMFLLAVLVLFQTVVLMHRVAHAQQIAESFSHSSPAELKDDVSLLATFWGDHGNSTECQLLDQSCPDFLNLPVWALFSLSAVPTWCSVTFAESFWLFERVYSARGPPAVLL
jgi:hypothetical protein